MKSDADNLARDEIIYLPVSSIDPDPDQPRLDVDAELADSIKQHGVLQSIEVRPHPSGADDRWMIVDGERRYQGAKRARLETIPATIRIDVEDAADRIVRQIVRNEGRPLTPVEEALAFKKIIDTRRAAGDKKYGVVQLARELGIAKSTIGDRLALTEIPAFWLELISKGPLQASHAPILHRWRKVPEKYHRAALEQMQKDYRWSARRKGGDRLYVEVFEGLVDQYFPKFAKPIADVPGYEGPTETLSVHNAYPARRAVHAMDPSKWGPIWRKGIAARRAKDAKKGKGTAAQRDNDNWQERERERRAKQETEEAAWRVALPGIVDQVAVAVNSGAIDAKLEQRLLHSDRHYGKEMKALLGKVVVGDGPRDVIRFLAYREILHDITPTWQGPREWPTIAKQLGLTPAKVEKKKRGTKAPAPDPAPAVGQLGDDYEAVACKYCECTEAAACELEDGSPCSWYDRSVPVCSNPSCVASYQEDVEASSDGVVSDTLGDHELEDAIDHANAADDDELEEVGA